MRYINCWILIPYRQQILPNCEDWGTGHSINYGQSYAWLPFAGTAGSASQFRFPVAGCVIIYGPENPVIGRQPGKPDLRKLDRLYRKWSLVRSVVAIA